MNSYYARVEPFWIFEHLYPFCSLRKGARAFVLSEVIAKGSKFCWDLPLLAFSNVLCFQDLSERHFHEQRVTLLSLTMPELLNCVMQSGLELNLEKPYCL